MDSISDESVRKFLKLGEKIHLVIYFLKWITSITLEILYKSFFKINI